MTNGSTSSVSYRTSTRSNPLEHVLLTVLKADNENHPIRRAFAVADVLSIDDMLDLSKDDLKDISWVADGTAMSLSISHINSIMAVGSWFRTQESTEDTTFLSLTPQILTDYRRSLASTPISASETVALGTSTGGAITTSTYTLSAADEFRKGIKRDMTAFRPLKDRKQWNPWHRAFRATATAQGLGNVLDAKYSPSNSDEQTVMATSTMTSGASLPLIPLYLRTRRCPPMWRACSTDAGLGCCIKFPLRSVG